MRDERRLNQRRLDQFFNFDNLEYSHLLRHA
jgi:hypothetical protein